MSAHLKNSSILQFLFLALCKYAAHNLFVLIVGMEAIEASLRRHAAARGPLARWTRITAQARWQNIIEVRKVFPTADAIKGTDLTCFNIGGGNFRLMTTILYQL